MVVSVKEKARLRIGSPHEYADGSRSGLWIGKMDDDNMRHLRTKDKKINLYIPELADWMEEIEPNQEAKALQPDPNYPLTLNGGRHKPENANTLMRNPAWNKGRRT